MSRLWHFRFGDPAAFLGVLSEGLGMDPWAARMGRGLGSAWKPGQCSQTLA